MVSALSQRYAQKGWESPNTVLSERLANDFRSFQEDFERLIENRAKLVIPDRMFRMLRMMMSSVTHEIYAVCQGLDMSLQDAEEAMERVQEQKERKATELVGITEKLSRIISHDSTEAEIWLSQLLQNMEQETNTLSACSTEQITKYYTFYCMDTLQKAITKCLDYHMDGIFNHLNEIGSGLAQSVMGTEYAESYSFQFHLDNKTWTKGDNIGFMVSFLGIGGVMNLVANAIGGTMRKQELQSRKMELVNAIRAQYPSLRKSVMECIQNSYQQIQKKITVQLAEYYAEELETVERLTEQAISVARQNEERKEEIRQAMRKLQDVMDKIRAFVTIREE
ncbi:MAG: hypothetical protein IJQ81_08225, partial [Oscillibacter sp.]|nr:hypothetical protein [Oscillibacter sp.]